MAIKKIKIGDKQFSLSYDIYNLDAEECVIFLHGWGSNREIMKVFKDYFFDKKLIFLDLPGFGKSSNDYVLTTKDYAEIIAFFLDSINCNRDMIFGHSFGGKVATLLNPTKLVLLSSAGIILKKPLNIRVKISVFKLLKKFGFGYLRSAFISDDAKNMSENMYETFKNVVNEDFREIFANYKGTAYVFGADQDKAVPIEAVKIQSKLLHVKAHILAGDHYFFFHGDKAKENRNYIVNLVR